MSRNVDRLIALAYLIEGLSPEKFDMHEYTHPCGTPSCLAGWAAWEAQGRPEEFSGYGPNIVQQAAEWLGLEGDPAHDVDDEFFRGNHGYFENQKITQKDAADHVRSVAAGGSLRWPAKFNGG